MQFSVRILFIIFRIPTHISRYLFINVLFVLHWLIGIQEAKKKRERRKRRKAILKKFENDLYTSSLFFFFGQFRMLVIQVVIVKVSFDTSNNKKNSISVFTIWNVFEFHCMISMISTFEIFVLPFSSSPLREFTHIIQSSHKLSHLPILNVWIQFIELPKTSLKF